MTYSYFPGCTLKTKGKDLDIWGRRSMEALGIELRELPQWQCCGAVYPQAKDEIATKLSAVRALASAGELETDLVTLCSACHHVIKRVNRDMQTDETIRSRVNNYLKPEKPYAGETRVLHYLEVLRDRVGFEELKKRVANPLAGRRIGAYYGCLLLRPSSEMGFDDPENPTILEDFIRAIGAEPVVYAMRNECCGGYTTIENKDCASRQAGKVLDNAAALGAEEVITACPLCLYNLRVNGGGKLPVRYFTELLAEALGVKEVGA
ncbi:MAG: CoB--CoM heterodisulfide reductase iron-sulfur subunit B family protein [Oscillospiraceae bacterium]|nr:disulfide reductase [Oscillospiraceae bacterium]MDE6998315.1 CoB--CoM heterodisulfide reductase iron-sulfur subunit B family protein [Oscillospiraceae bacterium]